MKLFKFLVLGVVVLLNAWLFFQPYQNQPGWPGDRPAGGHDITAYEQWYHGFFYGNTYEPTPVLHIIFIHAIQLTILLGFFFPSVFIAEIAFLPKRQPLFARIIFGAQTALMALGLFVVYYLVLKGHRIMVFPGDGSYPSNIPLTAAYIHFGLTSVATLISGVMTFCKKNPVGFVR